MNILIVKTVLQSWINRNDFALYEDDAFANYERIKDYCSKRPTEEHEEILECLDTLRRLDMVHILANK